MILKFFRIIQEKMYLLLLRLQPQLLVNLLHQAAAPEAVEGWRIQQVILNILLDSIFDFKQFNEHETQYLCSAHRPNYLVLKLLVKPFLYNNINHKFKKCRHRSPQFMGTTVQHLVFYQLGNRALPRLLTVTFAVYPHLMDFTGKQHFLNKSQPV